MSWSTRSSPFSSPRIGPFDEEEGALVPCQQLVTARKCGLRGEERWTGQGLSYLVYYSYARRGGMRFGEGCARFLWP